MSARVFDLFFFFLFHSQLQVPKICSLLDIQGARANMFYFQGIKKNVSAADLSSQTI